MKRAVQYIVTSLLTGLLIVIPLYLAILLLIKVLQSVARVVRPLARLRPEWLPAEAILALLLVLIVCFLVGVVIRTPAGRRASAAIDTFLLQKLPGYGLFQGLTQQVMGMQSGQVWKPALAEIAGALRLAFIIEDYEDGRYTVFIPSAPAAFSGGIYILTRERVHPLDIPLMQAMRCVTRWGSGSKQLVAAMKRGVANEPSRVESLRA